MNYLGKEVEFVGISDELPQIKQIVHERSAKFDLTRREQNIIESENEMSKNWYKLRKRFVNNNIEKSMKVSE